MARVKRGVIAGRRHKKILAKAKGYYNARRKVFRTAKQAVIKAGQYAYRDRRAKKRDMRALWITPSSTCKATARQTAEMSSSKRLLILSARSHSCGVGLGTSMRASTSSGASPVLR